MTAENYIISFEAKLENKDLHAEELDKAVVEDIKTAFRNAKNIGIAKKEVAKAECIICSKEFDMHKEGWLNNQTLNTEGICDECLESHGKTELLDKAVGN